MLAHNPWPSALWRTSLLVVLAVVIGLLLGHVLLVLLLASAAALVYQGWQLYWLDRWLRQGSRQPPPNSSGVWGEVLNGIYRLQMRHRSRRQRLATLLRGVRQTINAMPDGAVILQDDGVIRWWNTQARELLGLRWPQDEGQRIDNLLRMPEFSVFMETEDPQSERTIELPAPIDSRRILEIRIIPYGDEQSLLLARDISRLHQLEVMRRDFVANVSHELRSPLTVIRGVTETLQDSLAPAQAEMERPLALIDEQSQRMQMLVEDLLLLSRLETEETPPAEDAVNMGKVVSEVIEEAKVFANDERHIFETHLQPGLVILGEQSELRSICSNLILNAVKYTPAPGRILVRWEAANGGAKFIVEDTGIGIAEAHLGRLTERFYRVDVGRSRETGGTGLGLAIVKHLLGRYGSRLEVSSEVGVGSTFSCQFPSTVIKMSHLCNK